MPPEFTRVIVAVKLKQSTEQALGLEGAFSKHIDGFSFRKVQQQMAAEVAQSIENKATILAEAGTGTGKTFAYLTPSVLSGKKVIISTGTKNLQEQLFFRDLPIVLKCLGQYPKTALLKGRSNYLCLHRLALNLSGGLFREKKDSDAMHRVDEWSRLSKDGDLSTVPGVPESSRIWPMVSSTADNCLGQDCPKLSDCFVAKARKKALEADLVVINHHLFFADVALKNDGFGELLPSADAVVFDEAHQLPEIASVFFSDTFSTGQLNDLCRDVQEEYKHTAMDMSQMVDSAGRLQSFCLRFRQSFSDGVVRSHWRGEKENATVALALTGLLKELDFLTDVLDAAKERSQGLLSCFERAVRLKSLGKMFVETEQNSENVRWYEVGKRSVVLHNTPLSVADNMQKLMEKGGKAWIFTSATLAVNQTFEHFAGQLGIKEAKQLILDSPFDFERQAMFYVPRYLPDVNDAGYLRSFIDAVVPLIKAIGGRTFLLFTSHRALQNAAGLLEERISYPLLVQGSRNKAALLEQFRSETHSVLLGTNSFWEGVDIRGKQLSLVAIDKIPFGSPADPVSKAKIDKLREAGQDPFYAMQIPSAIITLKQGVGRLIRDGADSGVLVMGDQRLVAKVYGQRFVSSLPPMQRTRTLDIAMTFLQEQLIDE